MIGIDTNVLLRHTVQDDPAQSAAASAFMATLTPGDPGFVSLVTLLEATWTLRSRYRADLDLIAAFVLGLLKSEQLLVQEPDTVRRVANDSVATRTDFVDLLVAHLGIDHGADYTVTFDRRAALLPGMRLLE